MNKRTLGFVAGLGLLGLLVAPATAQAQVGKRYYCGSGESNGTCGPSAAPGIGNSCANAGCHARNPLNDPDGRVMKAAGSVGAIQGSPNPGMQAIVSLYTETELEAIAAWLMTLVGGSPPPTAKPSCTATASNPSPLVGTSVTLTASCTNAPTSYAWTGCTSGTATCLDSRASPGTQVYSVTATNSGGAATASVSVTWAATDGGGSAPPPALTQVVEFYHAGLDHYFLSSTPGETAFVDSGGAGAGWKRTGATFSVEANAARATVTPLCRFYGSVSPGPNSHFYTLDAGECAYLKQLQGTTPPQEPRWNYEGVAFGAGAASAGRCLDAGHPIPVYRLYNNGFAHGKDSNHRYATRQGVVADMVARGWSQEGVVFCVAQDGFAP